MGDIGMSMLRRDLQDMLDAWKATRHSPHIRCRDLRILFLKRVRMEMVKFPPYPPVIDYLPIADLIEEEDPSSLELERLNQLGKTAIESPAEICRCFWRDRRRQREVKGRSTTLPRPSKNTDVIEFSLDHGNVAQDGELYDLLEIFQDRLTYKHRCNLVAPLEEIHVHHRFSWHVSMGKYAEIEIIEGEDLSPQPRQEQLPRSSSTEEPVSPQPRQEKLPESSSTEEPVWV